MTTNEIIQGNCLETMPVRLDEFGQPVKCIITDPPYGVDFVSRRAETAEGKKFVKAIENDGDLEQAIAFWLEVMSVLEPRCDDEAELYLFTRWDIVGEWIEAVRSLDQFRYKMMLIWDKGVPGMGDIDSNWGCGHEIILYAKKGLRRVPYRRSAIIHVDKLGSKQHVHPTEKPVELIEKLIEMSTNRGDLVVDPTSGSGSAVVAAQRLGRHGLGFEKEPQYVDVSRRRLEQAVLF